METSKFAGLAGKTFTFAKLGAKTSDETRAELIATTAPNKFQINRLGSKLLNIQSGDRVKLIVDQPTEDLNAMFYLVVASAKDKDAALLASVGKVKGVGRSLVFNFSGVWSKMIQQNVEATELAAPALERMGLVVSRMTTPMKPKEGAENTEVNEPKLVYASKNKICYEIVDTEADMEIEGSVYHIWALTNLEIEEVNEDDQDDQTAE